MTSFLDINTNDVPTLECVPGNQEYKIQIIGFRTDDQDEKILTNKNGERYFAPIYELVDYPDSKIFNDYMGLPESSQDKRTQVNNASKIAKWKQCFDLPESGFDLSEAVGKQGWVILGKRFSEYSGEDENFIKKFITNNN